MWWGLVRRSCCFCCVLDVADVDVSLQALRGAEGKWGAWFVMHHAPAAWRGGSTGQGRKVVLLRVEEGSASFVVLNRTGFSWW